MEFEESKIPVAIESWKFLGLRNVKSTGTVSNDKVEKEESL